MKYSNETLNIKEDLKNICFENITTFFFLFFLYQHLHIKPKNLQSPGIHIYVVIYLGTKKYTYKILKKYKLKIIER